LEIHTASAEHPATARPPQHTAPAAKVTSSVETAVRNVIAGDALGPEEEQALIRDKWR
jgi:hypothetical protein